MTQVELDRAYDQAAYAPECARTIARFKSRSEQTRNWFGEPETISYGDAASERLELYRGACAQNSPVVLFVHGGAWRSGKARDYSFLAAPFTTAGLNFISIDFDWIQNCDNGLGSLVRQVAKALAYVALRGTAIGVDPSNIFLAGHSSGAHLLACCLTLNWLSEYGISPSVFRHALLISGVYDLLAVRLSARNQYMKISDTDETNFSPIRHVESIKVPVTVSYATGETPEFLRQSREFAAALYKRGLLVESITVPDCSHFEIVESLSDPFAMIGRHFHATLKSMSAGQIPAIAALR